MRHWAIRVSGFVRCLHSKQRCIVQMWAPAAPASPPGEAASPTESLTLAAPVDSAVSSTQSTSFNESSNDMTRLLRRFFVGGSSTVSSTILLSTRFLGPRFYNTVAAASTAPGSSSSPKERRNMSEKRGPWHGSADSVPWQWKLTMCIYDGTSVRHDTSVRRWDTAGRGTPVRYIGASARYVGTVRRYDTSVRYVDTSVRYVGTSVRNFDPVWPGMAWYAVRYVYNDTSVRYVGTSVRRHVGGMRHLGPSSVHRCIIRINVFV